MSLLIAVDRLSIIWHYLAYKGGPGMEAEQGRIVFMLDADLKDRFEKTVKDRELPSLTHVLRKLVSNWTAENKRGPGRPKKTEKV